MATTKMNVKNVYSNKTEALSKYWWSLTKTGHWLLFCFCTHFYIIFVVTIVVLILHACMLEIHLMKVPFWLKCGVLHCEKIIFWETVCDTSLT